MQSGEGAELLKQAGSVKVAIVIQKLAWIVPLLRNGW